LEDDHKLSQKVKKQIVEPTICLHVGSQKPLSCISKKYFCAKALKYQKNDYIFVVIITGQL
jgi:hypothetical protein